MKRLTVVLLFLAMAGAFAGCANYRWTSSVPSDRRTVSVPVFRNESSVTELGNVITTQLAREFQREGTMSLRATGESALEIQGVVKSARISHVTSDRAVNRRIKTGDLKAVVEISVIDKKAGAVLVDNRKYVATASLTFMDDVLTAERDASGRLAEDLARQVVDDVLNIKF